MNGLKITLRPYRISDVDDFLRYAGDEKVTYFTRWDTFTSKEEALSYIKDFCIPHPYCRSICIGGDEDRSIGFMILFPGEGEDRCRATIGYALAAEYWGRGIATRAVEMAVLEGFREFPHFVRIQGLVLIENKASQRVLEKLGFTKEGILRKYTYNKGEVRDLIMYSILSSDLVTKTTLP